MSRNGAAPAREPAVRTIGLDKRFGRRTVLHALDLTVGTGTIFGYLGPNGAGKTTTLKLLVGLYRPSAGRVLVLGHDVATERARVRRRIGYLPGDFAGYADQTGERFLALLASLRGGIDQRHVRELAERFDLDLTRRLGTLSHGSRQKVGIVQAFMHRPELLILDEPTNGLDPLMQREFLDLLRETRASGATVILSSHVLSEVSAVADEVGILSDGRLLATREVAGLREQATRRLELVLQRPVAAEVLRAIRGVRDVHVCGTQVAVSLTGSAAELVRVLATYGVEDVRCHETDLSDLFLSYYDHPEESHDDLGVPQSALGPAALAPGVG